MHGLRVIKTTLFSQDYFWPFNITSRKDTIPRAFPVRIPVASLKFCFQVIGVVSFMNCNNSLDEAITDIGH